MALNPFEPESSGTPLHQYLTRIAEKVKTVPEAWIIAEVAKITRHASGHVYIDLADSKERSDGTTEKLAAAHANLWKGNAARLLDKFERGCGRALAQGMKVRLRVRPDFSAQHGFSLVVMDIDPAFTLGSVESNIAAIREKLKAAGEYTLNRERTEPGDFTRVAVISPAQAAGLADFRSAAERLAAAGLCAFDYYTAVFQGRETEASIVEAFRLIHEQNDACRAQTGYDRYDAVAIIRGGGARGDLDWLNTYRIVRWVARFPLPVWVGIGHHTDSVLLDEVAHRAFDTPSKVIHGIADRIVVRARQAQQAIDAVVRQVELRTRGAQARVESRWDGVARGARHLTERCANRTQRASDAIHAGARARVIESGTQLERQFGVVVLRARQMAPAARAALARDGDGLERGARQRAGDARRAFAVQGQLLAGSAGAALGRLSHAINVCVDATARAARAALARAADGLAREAAQLNQGPRVRVTAVQDAIDLWIRQIVLLGPEKTLARGFAIVRDESGKPVVRGAAIASGARLALEFQDGKIQTRRDD